MVVKPYSCTSSNVDPDPPAYPPLSLVSPVDRSDECIDYLIAKTMMAHQNLIKKRANLCEAILAGQTISAPYASSQVDERTDDCIDYLIARSEMKLRIAIERLARLNILLIQMDPQAAIGMLIHQYYEILQDEQWESAS